MTPKFKANHTETPCPLPAHFGSDSMGLPLDGDLALHG